MSFAIGSIVTDVVGRALATVTHEALSELRGEHGELLDATRGLRDAWGWWDAGTVPYEHRWDPERFEGVGEPLDLAPFQRTQVADDTCAVVAQATVLESLTGEHVTEAEAAACAEELGLYVPGEGTSPEAFGQLLEHYGVACEKMQGAEVTDLVDALERGDRVLVAVNALEIWRPTRDEFGEVVPQLPPAGHAVWVTGIDCQDGEWTVILNDSGTPDGAMSAVSLDDFMQSWDDFDNLAVFAHAPEG